MEFKLRVSRVLVTGGGSGIGKAIAKALLDEGCYVCICGRNLEKLEKVKEEFGNDRLSCMQWDVRDVSLIWEKINEAASLCGGYLDGLVNNAGVYVSHHNWKPWNETEEEWDAVWDTNLKGPMFLLRKFATYLNNNHIKGNIFCVSSIESRNYNIQGSYQGSKYAFSEMVRSHAKKVLNLGIVINGICPGIVASSLNDYNAGDPTKSCALGRILSPEEIAACALFLMSDAATICCGEMLDASGGFYAAF
ncbi:SDR family oxidoreductase [Selenomonas sp. AB3002]|uniref:SDR family NAD(P)-dependent oxidoreductase n=1 Tax=Selenomonas sp. AB3002 TaxID=1392502 RepID=UPI0004951CD8